MQSGWCGDCEAHLQGKLSLCASIEASVRYSGTEKDVMNSVRVLGLWGVAREGSRHNVTRLANVGAGRLGVTNTTVVVEGEGRCHMLTA